MVESLKCFEKDMHIDGGNIQNSKNEFLSSGSDCQKRCQDNLECNHFVFDQLTNQCILKRSDAAKSYKVGSLIGPKYCGKHSF